MIVVMVMIRVRVCRAYRLERWRRRLRPVGHVVALLASPEREDRHWGVLVVMVLMMMEQFEQVRRRQCWLGNDTEHSD